MKYRKLDDKFEVRTSTSWERVNTAGADETLFILVPVPGHGARVLDRGQTSKICEKQGKYSKGKVVTFTVQSSILYQYPVDLLTFFELY